MRITGGKTFITADIQASEVGNDLCSTRESLYWHRFEGNLGETGERRDGVRMDLPERFGVILSRI